MLTMWYRSGGKHGRPLEGQALIELAFELHKLPEELQQSDPIWLNKMLASQAARIEARKK